jgi:hypothetical protein
LKRLPTEWPGLVPVDRGSSHSDNPVLSERAHDTIVVCMASASDHTRAGCAFLFERSPVRVALVLNSLHAGMIFVAIYRSRASRFVAALIIALVVSPYSEPFATIDGTDFSGAGAVDVVSGSKLKTISQDLIVVPQVAVFLRDESPTAVRPLVFSLTIQTHRDQRAILRV